MYTLQDTPDRKVKFKKERNKYFFDWFSTDQLVKDEINLFLSSRILSQRGLTSDFDFDNLFNLISTYKHDSAQFLLQKEDYFLDVPKDMIRQVGNLLNVVELFFEYVQNKSSVEQRKYDKSMKCGSINQIDCLLSRQVLVGYHELSIGDNESFKKTVLSYDNSIPVLGVDCEWYSCDEREILSTVQFSTGTSEIFVYDMLIATDGDKDFVKYVLESSTILKIFHDCRMDAYVLEKWRGVKLSGIYDTQVAFFLFNGRSLPPISLANLISRKYDFYNKFNKVRFKDNFVNKKFWSIRPFTVQSERYLMEDVFFLPFVYYMDKLAHPSDIFRVLYYSSLYKDVRSCNRYYGIDYFDQCCRLQSYSLEQRKCKRKKMNRIERYSFNNPDDCFSQDKIYDRVRIVITYDDYLKKKSSLKVKKEKRSRWRIRQELDIDVGRAHKPSSSRDICLLDLSSSCFFRSDELKSKFTVKDLVFFIPEVKLLWRIVKGRATDDRFLSLLVYCLEANVFGLFYQNQDYVEGVIRFDLSFPICYYFYVQEICSDFVSRFGSCRLLML